MAGSCDTLIFVLFKKIDKFDLNMYLFVHSNLGNNKFCEIKSNHKVNNLFCTHAVALYVFVMIDLSQISKDI
jgi:hypothetical protein